MAVLPIAVETTVENFDTARMAESKEAIATDGAE